MSTAPSTWLKNPVVWDEKALGAFGQTGQPIVTRSLSTYPPNLVVFVHADSWMNNAQLMVLSIRDTGPKLEAYVPRDYAQVFAIGQHDGTVRNAGGTGQNLEARIGAQCVARSWEFQHPPGQHPLLYTMSIQCPEGRRSLGTLSGTVLLMDDKIPPTSWFVVPVAQTS